MFVFTYLTYYYLHKSAKMTAKDLRSPAVATSVNPMILYNIQKVSESQVEMIQQTSQLHTQVSKMILMEQQSLDAKEAYNGNTLFVFIQFFILINIYFCQILSKTSIIWKFLVSY